MAKSTLLQFLFFSCQRGTHTRSGHHVTLLNLHLSEAWDQEETKMAPGKWRALQTPKHPKHYSGCTHVITLDRFLEEWKCADSATGTSRTSLN